MAMLYWPYVENMLVHVNERLLMNPAIRTFRKELEDEIVILEKTEKQTRPQDAIVFNFARVTLEQVLKRFNELFRIQN